MAVIPMGARIFGGELVGELVPWPYGFLRDVRHSIHGVGVDGPVEVNGVGEIVSIPQVDLDPVSFFYPDRRARNPGRRDHPFPLGGKDPEGDELSRIDLLLDLDDL